MSLYLISFSPTGSTRRVLDLLAKGWENEPYEVVELCSAEPVRPIEFTAEDVCLVGAPVYGGRIPAMQADRLKELFGECRGNGCRAVGVAVYGNRDFDDALVELRDILVEGGCRFVAGITAVAEHSIVQADRLKELFGECRGNGCRAVGVAVYGNRDFDDALVELRDILVEGGCRFVAGITAVAEHSIVRVYGAGRPDEADAKELLSFGKQIREAMQKEMLTEPQIPGNRPYKEGGKGGPHPLPNENCVRCGQCARKCPAAAISADGQQLDETKDRKSTRLNSSHAI